MEQIDISSNVQIPHSYPSMPTSFAPQDNLAYILGKAAKVPFHGSFANARDQKCRLLALPTEIRQQIFSYVLPYTIKQEKRTGQSGHDIVWCRSSTALFAASKQLHQECSTLLYGDAMFDVSVWYDSIRLEFRQLLDSGLIPKTTPKFLETVLPRYWQYVRNLRVTINIEDDYTGMIKYNCGGRGLPLGVTAQVRRLVDILRRPKRLCRLEVELLDRSALRVSGVPNAEIVLDQFFELRGVLNSCWSGTLPEDLAEELAHVTSLIPSCVPDKGEIHRHGRW